MGKLGELGIRRGHAERRYCTREKGVQAHVEGHFQKEKKGGASSTKPFLSKQKRKMKDGGNFMEQVENT